MVEWCSDQKPHPPNPNPNTQQKPTTPLTPPTQKKPHPQSPSLFSFWNREVSFLPANPVPFHFARSTDPFPSDSQKMHFSWRECHARCSFFYLRASTSTPEPLLDCVPFRHRPERSFLFAFCSGNRTPVSGGCAIKRPPFHGFLALVPFFLSPECTAEDSDRLGFCGAPFIFPVPYRARNPLSFDFSSPRVLESSYSRPSSKAGLPFRGGSAWPSHSIHVVLTSPQFFLPPPVRFLLFFRFSMFL